MALPNYYKVLGVSPRAQQFQIREAYLAIAAREHPNANQNGDVAKFREANEAYNKLFDPKLRALYDAQRRKVTPACPECGGEGFVRRQRGLTAAVNVPCLECKGTGDLV